MSPATTADHRSDDGPQRIDSRVVPLDYIDVLPYYSFVTLFLCLLSFSPHHVFPLSHAVLCCIVFMPRHCFATLADIFLKLADIFLKLHFCPELDLSPPPPPLPRPPPPRVSNRDRNTSITAHSSPVRLKLPTFHNYFNTKLTYRFSLWLTHSYVEPHPLSLSHPNPHPTHSPTFLYSACWRQLGSICLTEIGLHPFRAIASLYALSLPATTS